jgi:hypothetical protein
LARFRNRRSYSGEMAASHSKYSQSTSAPASFVTAPRDGSPVIARANRSASLGVEADSVLG